MKEHKMSTVPDDVATKADQIRSSLEHESAEIEKNMDLTPDARSRLLAEARAVAQGRMDELRQSWRGQAKVSTTAALTSLLNVGGYGGADAISSRDAQDRAARLESASEAMDLLERARLTRDDVLVGAIAAEAWRRSQGNDFFSPSWGRVLDAYVDGDPARAAKLAKLRGAAEQTDRGGILDLAALMTFAI